MFKLSKTIFALAGIMLLMISCDNQPSKSEKDSMKLAIDFEKYELENGLQVVLHQDKTDPVVALAIQYGVGSNRESTGKTGFAHLFEHMLFQESENVGQDQFFKIISCYSCIYTVIPVCIFL